MIFTNKTYDVLKWIAQILLPALGTLYFAIASIWGLPAPEQVVGTIVAVDAFLGIILGLSSAAYNNVVATGVSNPNALTPAQLDAANKTAADVKFLSDEEKAIGPK